MSFRAVWLCVRCGVAIALLVLAHKFGAGAFAIPLEAGGVLFAPMLLGMAALCVIGALALVVPWWRQGSNGGAGFWSALADIFFPF